MLRAKLLYVCRRPLGVAFKRIHSPFIPTSLYHYNYAPFSSASASFDVDNFCETFVGHVEGVAAATDPTQSSRELRKLVKTKSLMFTDMRDHPEKFFMAHRLLSTIGLSGFGIRFTVQFNLFAGSILGLGGPEHVSMLDSIQERGQLGCFLLTEMQAGVLSGLIVKTTADWDPKLKKFILNTPDDRAAKNWISQGYTAELGVVIADLRINGKSYGPHPFFMNLRDGEEGELLPGIRIEDMGIKTVANDLDNARVWFDNVQLPKSALLNKFCDIDDNNEYVQKGEKMRIEVIGQRLLTGRMAIAQAALVSCRVLHMKTEEYAKEKVCNGLSGETSLYSMPQLTSVFNQSYREIDSLMQFTAAIEEKLNFCLRNGTIPDPNLVDAVSVCKTKAVSVALERSQALRLEVGSYALMHGTGFELVDMFFCCKFAEGDSRILQMKLTRDRLKQLKKDGFVKTFLQIFGKNGKEALAAMRLALKLRPAGRDLKKMDQLFTDNWREIYDLASLIEDRHVDSVPGKHFLEPVTVRFRPSQFTYDQDWKIKLRK